MSRKRQCNTCWILNTKVWLVDLVVCLNMLHRPREDWERQLQTGSGDVWPILSSTQIQRSFCNPIIVVNRREIRRTWQGWEWCFLAQHKQPAIALQELLIVFIKGSWRKFKIVPPENGISTQLIQNLDWKNVVDNKWM